MAIKFKEFKRFEKQIILKKVGIAGQEKIKRAKVLIIGIGGLGCPLLTYLASSGINNIGIVDHDKVELGNLNRQILFNTSDLGKYKVVQAKSKVIKIYKKIKIKTFKKKILISGAISKFDGHLFKFNFKKKIPCFRCFMPELPIRENNCETEGIFSPVAGILGSLQANEVLKTVLNLKDDLNNNFLVFNSLKMTLRRVKINKNPKCLNKCV